MRTIVIVDYDAVPERPSGIKRFAESLGLRLVLGCEISGDGYVDDVHTIGMNLTGKILWCLRKKQKQSFQNQKLTETYVTCFQKKECR